ncbi:hypothetical protein PROFUN_11059 [Planoprotostelium fungivorum]|uniref:rRNA adenine N(6)-methyltransferase n=1 Tax=Planoprotostelium fungivorum TaxID=1890364 RepID=A0A2P6NBR1_9EUKA|nr:hypothetical protein PROFUN_11059 [Planoprotostelium fungivorum]
MLTQRFQEEKPKGEEIMRPLTEEETKVFFEKLTNYIGRNVAHLVDRPKDPHVFRLHKQRVYYVREEVMRQATSIDKKGLISLGTCFGKFTGSGKFKLHVTCLDYLSQYAQYKVWVKPSSEMSVLYGNNVYKAGLGRITENTPKYQGVVIYSMNDTPLGFGTTARSTQECRKVDVKQVFGDVTRLLRELEVHLWKWPESSVESLRGGWLVVAVLSLDHEVFPSSLLPTFSTGHQVMLRHHLSHSASRIDYEEPEALRAKNLNKLWCINRSIKSPCPTLRPSYCWNVRNKSTEKLPQMPSVAEIIRLYGLSAQQKLSQNFLLDLNLTDKMVKMAGDLSNTTVIEVGPGPGGLTRSILKAGAKRLIVIEKDPRCLPALEVLQQAVSKQRMHIVMDDVLTVDEEECVIKASEQSREPIDFQHDQFLFLGNLPFSIGTPLLLKWLYQIERKQGLFKHGRAPMIMLLQKEVADRIGAAPGDDDFSRLSVMMQRWCDVQMGFKIPGSAFVPPPKVDTRVIKMTPRNRLKSYPDVPLEAIEHVARNVFGQRRKMLSNSIQTLGAYGSQLLENQDIILDE